MKANLDKLERLGQLRFPSGAEFEKFVSERSSDTVKIMLDNLADNYPDVDTSRIASLYKVFCEERERALKSMGDIADDQFYNDTRPEYLFQILGDMLFINEKASGAEYTDKTYREFLLKVKDAYLGGSSEQNIDKSLSEIIGLPVEIKQLYLEARKEGSAYTIKDTHKLVADLFLTDATTEEMQYLSVIIQDLYYFIKLIKPAHTLFDTRLIWAEDMSLTGCDSSGFAMDVNGNTLQYAFLETPDDYFEPVEDPQTPADFYYNDTNPDNYSLYRLVVTDDSTSEIIGEDWVSGEIALVDSDRGYIVLTSGAKLVISRLSTFYKDFVDGDEEYTQRIEQEDLNVGDNIWFFASLAPGWFSFLSPEPPQVLIDNVYRQFDPLVIFSAEFQGKVIVDKDSTGNMLQEASCTNALQDTAKMYVLKSEYEDLRDNCDLPSPKIFNEVYITPGTPEMEVGDGYLGVSGYVNISDDTNAYVIPQLPVSSEDGDLATADDLVVYIDNQRVADGVESIDPWTGEVFLNFNPPVGSLVRLDYWFRDIYPESVTTPDYSGSGIAPTIPPVDGDVHASVSIGNAANPIIKFIWPFPIPAYEGPETDYSFYGNNMSYQMDEFPMLKYNGDLAEAEDIIVLIDGVEAPGVVDFVRPLLGHVQLNTTVPPESNVSFQYYYQSSARTYHFMLDSEQHLTDLVFGVNANYTLITASSDFVDGNANVEGTKMPAEYGYRYDALDLGYSSVWNSEDTFKLNDYEMVNGVANVGNTPSKYNRYKLQYSSEYLYDTSKHVDLDSDYKFNDLEPLLKLRKDIPPFYRTFTSWAEYIYQDGTEPEDATPSGLIEHVPLPELATIGRFRYLGDTKEAITVEGDETMSLTTICDDRLLDIGINVFEEYYPSRELRLNDYRDYLRISSVGYKEGTAQVEDGSNILVTFDDHAFTKESVETIVLDVNGTSTEYTITDVIDNNTLEVGQAFSGVDGPYSYVVANSSVGYMHTLENSNIAKAVGGHWANMRKNYILNVYSYDGTTPVGTYTVAELLDGSTIRLSRPFNLSDGKYSYKITIPVVEGYDVLLNNVIRKKTFDLSVFEGHTGTIELNFPDPDLDPYPRNDGGTPVTPPLLSSEINGPESEYNQGGREKYLQDKYIADKLVKYRNFDQEMIVFSIGTFSDTIIDPMDDDASDFKYLFHNPNLNQNVEYTFQGSLMITTERPQGDTPVDVGDYPNALIKLDSPYDTDGMDDAQYLYRIVKVHQLLADNSVDIVTYEEFVRI